MKPKQSSTDTWEELMKELNPYYREYIKELYGKYPEELVTKHKTEGRR